MKKYCIFPDQSRFELHKNLSILDITDSQTLVAYVDEEAGSQVLWVPNDFITND